MIVEQVNTAGGLSASREGSSPLRAGCSTPRDSRLVLARVPLHCPNDHPRVKWWAKQNKRKPYARCRVGMNNYERYHKCILELLQKLLEPVPCDSVINLRPCYCTLQK